MKLLKVLCLFGAAVIFLVGFGAATAGTIKGKITTIGVKDAGDVVVYIEQAPGEFKPPTEHAKMDQKNLTFIPHVLPILAGTTVDFLNSDDVLHNVFSPDKCAGRFNLGSWPKGEVRSHTFTQPDCQAVILCNIHAEMEARVVVLQNPYFYKTGEGGAFTIDNVPAGKYTLKVWHEKLRAPLKEISVPAKGEITVNFVMKR